MKTGKKHSRNRGKRGRNKNVTPRGKVELLPHDQILVLDLGVCEERERTLGDRRHSVTDMARLCGGCGMRHREQQETEATA